MVRRRSSDWPALLFAAVGLIAVVALSVLVGFVGAPSHTRFDWTLASVFGTALGTTLLATATGWLSYSTRSEVRATQDLAELTQEAQAATLRPILADARPDSDDAGTDRIHYAQGGQYLDLKRSNLHVDFREDQLLCSVALRNVGPGVAIVQDDARLYHPNRDTPYIGLPTRKVVPAGDLTRLTFVVVGRLDPVAFDVEVPYTDANGKQRSTTRLRLDQISGTWGVRKIFLSTEGRETVESGGAA